MTRATQENPVRESVLLALLLHLALAALSMVVPVQRHFYDPEENVHRFRVKSAPAEASLSRKARAFIHPLQSAAAVAARVVKDVPLESVADVKESRTSEFRGRITTDTELDHILSRLEEKKLKEAVKARRRSTAASAPRAAPRARPVDEKHLLETLRVGVDPEEGMPAFMPGFLAQAGERGEAAPDRAVGEARQDVSTYEPLDAFLDVEVFTYPDPADEGKYFMVRIFPKEGARGLRVMSKEILFAMDCSLSISPARLEEFKKGIRFCLMHLNEGDVFNIVAFKDETVFFSGEPLAASPETVAGAERFVAGLASTKRTDMHTALRKIVETPLHHEPSNILLLSDGRPTSGIVDAREFLASLTRLNGKTRPIFVYSGGAKVNRYLLDFIAYQNRGWSQFTKRGSEIATGLADFYRKIKDPIFLHLRYRFNRLDESGIYPKSLPDFYKNTEFTLYGTYRTENEFSMQLLGDIEGETKELVFTRSLDDAPKGGPDIMKGWAFNKIYHLIDQVTREGNRPELLKAIEDLSRKYGIQTPYSPELQRLD